MGLSLGQSSSSVRIPGTADVSLGKAPPGRLGRFLRLVTVDSCRRILVVAHAPLPVHRGQRPRRADPVEQPRPSHLYRYRSLADGPSLEASPREWTRQIFQDNKLYFPTIDQCNDPFEGRYRLSFDAPLAVKVEGYTKILQKQEGMAEEQAREVARETVQSGATEYIPPDAKQRVRNAILYRTPILSLVASKDNILMWSHYAEKHHGICIEFDLEADPEFFKDVSQVCYRKDRPTIPFWFWQDTPQQMAETSCLAKSCHTKPGQCRSQHQI